MLEADVPRMTLSGKGPSSELSAMPTRHISFSLSVWDNSPVFSRAYSLLKLALIDFIGTWFESCMLNRVSHIYVLQYLSLLYGKSIYVPSCSFLICVVQSLNGWPTTLCRQCSSTLECLSQIQIFKVELVDQSLPTHLLQPHSPDYGNW